MADWAEIMPVQIGKVLDRDGVAVHVAHNPGETDRSMDLHGWIATEREYLVSVKGKLTDPRCPLVHYVYVKAAYRRQVIARGLFAAAGVDPLSRFLYTCRVGLLSSQEFDAQTRIPRARWEPLTARFRK